VTALLTLEGVDAGYDGIPVVRGLDLTVEEGEVVALLGPNGAGKTTVLRTISALIPLLAGELVVLGRAEQGRAVGTRRNIQMRANRGLGHVPEDRSLFFELTALENVRLGARRGDHAAVETALGLFPQLEPIRHRRAGLLSGGEQQMLALARMLARRPKLLMIDEMSLGLAPVIVENLLPIVREVADETGAGVLLVEQHVPAALRVADRAYVLRRGRVAIEGSAAELRDRRELLLASYLGADDADSEAPPPEG
jgi:branched-chain amino acid transport system ATP-binding protein